MRIFKFSALIFETYLELPVTPWAWKGGNIIERKFRVNDNR